MRIFGFPIRWVHVIIIIILGFYLAGHYGLIKPVNAQTGTMSTVSDFTDKLKTGPSISGTTIPYWMILLALVVIFLFFGKGPRVYGPVSGTTKTLTEEVKFSIPK